VNEASKAPAAARVALHASGVERLPG